ncbi:MAG: hypothetical protein ACYC4U_11205 [Pirellulaceae bacterium]
MLKEFVEAISGLAVKSKEPTIVRNDFDPRTAYLVHDGEMKEIEVPAPLLTFNVETFQSLFEAFAEFGGASGSVWHGRDSIVALVDNTDRREAAVLKLRHSDQFLSLKALPKSFSQRDLILFLKRNLAGAVDDTYIAIFSKIDFQKREEGTSKVAHGDESLGKSVHASVTGSSDIPKFITATVLVYSNPDVRVPVTIRMSVDIDIQRCMIDLTPLPDEIENAILAAQGEIGERLRSEAPENATVFYGVPVARN